MNQIMASKARGFCGCPASKRARAIAAGLLPSQQLESQNQPRLNPPNAIQSQSDRLYLYPLRPGTAPVAAHVEARQRQGGAAVDRGACIREVEKR
jgi:hypothetical protein